MVIIIPNVNHPLQRQRFRRVLDEPASFRQPINRALEVDVDGGDVSYNLYEMA